MPSLDSIGFDVSAFAPRGGKENLRLWCTPAGDDVGLFYQEFPVAIRADATDALRASLRGHLAESGAALVEFEVSTLAGCPAMCEIHRVPQQPHGNTYFGSITLTWRDFSFMINARCCERGTTGVREAVVLDELMGLGKVTFASGTLYGWVDDVAMREGLSRNLCEAEHYDSRFPEHPLSRLRLLLRQAAATIRLEDDARDAAPFSR